MSCGVILVGLLGSTLSVARLWISYCSPVSSSILPRWGNKVSIAMTVPCFLHGWPIMSSPPINSPWLDLPSEYHVCLQFHHSHRIFGSGCLWKYNIHPDRKSRLWIMYASLYFLRLVFGFVLLIQSLLLQGPTPASSRSYSGIVSSTTPSSSCKISDMTVN